MGQGTPIYYCIRKENIMGISITEQVTDNSFANGEQGLFSDEGVAISIATTWKEEVEEAQAFTGQDFEKALKRVSRRVKK